MQKQPFEAIYYEIKVLKLPEFSLFVHVSEKKDRRLLQNP